MSKVEIKIATDPKDNPTANDLKPGDFFTILEDKYGLSDSTVYRLTDELDEDDDDLKIVDIKDGLLYYIKPGMDVKQVWPVGKFVFTRVDLK